MANFCTNCGKPIKEGARFCTNCGKPVIAMQPVNNATVNTNYNPVFHDNTVVENKVETVFSAEIPAVENKIETPVVEETVPVETAINAEIPVIEEVKHEEVVYEQPTPVEEIVEEIVEEKTDNVSVSDEYISVENQTAAPETINVENVVEPVVNDVQTLNRDVMAQPINQFDNYSTVNDYVSVAKPDKEKKYFGWKNIPLFILNAGMIALFFLKGLGIKIGKVPVIEALKDGLNLDLSIGQLFISIIKFMFGIGSINTGIEFLDESISSTGELVRIGAFDDVFPQINYLKIVGIVGMVFVLLAVIAAIVSLIKTFAKKRSVAGNVLSIFSSLYGLLLVGAIIVLIFLFKGQVMESVQSLVPEGMELIPIDFGPTLFAYVFVAVALVSFIFSLATIKK